jgi:predicted nucleic acid-binding protein
VRTVLLDNEAVMALADARHYKHRAVVAHLAGVTARRRKGTAARVMVATAVRVEAGWDRSKPGAAAVNRYPVADVPLDAGTANMAASIVKRTGVSVADAHIGAVVRSLAGDEVVVLTSDPDDMVRVSTPRPITTVRI